MINGNFGDFLFMCDCVKVLRYWNIECWVFNRYLVKKHWLQLLIYDGSPNRKEFQGKSRWAGFLAWNNRFCQNATPFSLSWVLLSFLNTGCSTISSRKQLLITCIVTRPHTTIMALCIRTNLNFKTKLLLTHWQTY